jgi:hypothetical protein
VTRQHGGDNETMADIFAQYGPPFDLTSDMLFVLALCPTRPLRRTFPAVPFVSLLGKTPLLIWFSRIKQMCYQDAEGQRRCTGGLETSLYDEVNVAALLRERALFVPGIYATSELTIRVGHRYGMPKQLTTMWFQCEPKRLCAVMKDGKEQSMLLARRLGAGRRVARLLSRLWPRQIWPVHFPSGSNIRPLLQATPSGQWVYVKLGQLALEATWLAGVVALLPIGFYVPNLQMQLPSPEEMPESHCPARAP